MWPLDRAEHHRKRRLRAAINLQRNFRGLLDRYKTCSLMYQRLCLQVSAKAQPMSEGDHAHTDVALGWGRLERALRAVVYSASAAVRADAHF